MSALTHPVIGSAGTHGSRSPKRSFLDRNWAVWFLLSEMVCQLLLLFPVAGPFRIFLRAGSFGGSLLLILLLSGKGRRHPAAIAGSISLILIVLALFHPETNSIFSGVTDILFHAAIIAPLFWVPRLNLDAKSFRAIVLTLWSFHVLSSIVGILQVYFPGQFQPNISTVVLARKGYLHDLMITLPGGARIPRPMGLTDVPGGAATSGFYTVVLGLGMLLTERRRSLQAAALGAMFFGMMCLYLSQVRATFIVINVSIIALLFVLALRRAKAQLAIVASVASIVIFLSFAWAVSVGGDAVTKRFSTLTKGNPGQTYSQNRGRFLRDTVVILLPRYPLGAGLARYGMMNVYFADHRKPSLWVEIQWTAWLFDGGIPMLAACIIAMVLTIRTTWRIAFSRDRGSLAIWGAILFAYDWGIVALTFSYPVFSGQFGIEFWLLNAALYTASRTMIQQAVESRKPAYV
jgi:hypothetical protein